MKTDLDFRNEYDQQHFNDIISRWWFVHLEVSWRCLGPYKHVLYTPYESYNWYLYTTDIFKKIPDRNNLMDIWVYSWRFLRVERVIWQVSIVSQMRLAKRYIDQEIKWLNSKPATLEWLQKQNLF